MASGIPRGWLRTTTAAELRNMVIIDSCQNKVSVGKYHVTISRGQVYSSSRPRVLLKLTGDQVQVIDWIMGSCQVNLLETGQDCSEAG